MPQGRADLRVTGAFIGGQPDKEERAHRLGGALGDSIGEPDQNGPPVQSPTVLAVYMTRGRVSSLFLSTETFRQAQHDSGHRLITSRDSGLVDCLGTVRNPRRQQMTANRGSDFERQSFGLTDC